MIEPPPAAIIGSITAWMPAHRAGEVDVDHLLEPGDVSGLERRDLDYAGIVDQHVELAESCTAVSTAAFQSSALVTSRCT